MTVDGENIVLTWGGNTVDAITEIDARSIQMSQSDYTGLLKAADNVVFTGLLQTSTPLFQLDLRMRRRSNIDWLNAILNKLLGKRYVMRIQRDGTIVGDEVVR